METMGIWLGFGITGLVLVIMGLVFVPIIVGLMKNSAQTKELLQNGLAAQAVILQVSDTGVTINDNPQARLLVEVRPVEAQPFQAEIKTIVSRFQVAQLYPGALIEVKYNPSDKSKVALSAIMNSGMFGAMGAMNAQQVQAFSQQLQQNLINVDNHNKTMNERSLN